MTSELCIQVTNLTHRYKETAALSDVSFSVAKGRLFGLLGPNGSGKTTLFRLLATLLPLQNGDVQVCDNELRTQPDRIRRSLGVTFQSPAVDPRLTVVENLQCHGRIYSIAAAPLRLRIDELLEQFALTDRRKSIVGELSGGLRRRVELAKGLLHRPTLLLLDEPSTGLDPSARRQFWDLIHDQREREGTTVIVTTHLMEEAEGCEQLLLLDRGRVVAKGTPQELQSSLDGERLNVRARNLKTIRPQLESLLNCEGRLVGDRICFRLSKAAIQLQNVMTEFGDEIHSIEVARPTLEDVFLEKTNRDVFADEESV